jgi:transposase
MKQVGLFDYGRIKSFKDMNLSLRQIAEKVGYSKTTVSNILKKLEQNKEPGRRLGSGPSFLLTDDDKEEIGKIIKKDPKISVPKIAKELQERIAKRVSESTISRHLKKHGFKSCRVKKRPLLTKKHKTCRFDVCQKWSYESKSFWEKVIFSDESKFNLITSDGIQRVWRKPGTGLQDKYLSKTVKHGGGYVMTWGCISSKGVGMLEFIDGTMDKYKYCSILAKHLPQSAAKMGLDSFIFQQDNDPKHTSQHVKKFFEEKKIEILPWPSQSPDLNPIEHVWAQMKLQLGGCHFRTKDELKEKLLSIWNEITPAYCEKLISTMPKRVNAVLRAKGSATKF